MAAEPSRDAGRADTVALREHLEAMIKAESCYLKARILALEKASEIEAERLKERIAATAEARRVANEVITMQIDRMEDDIANLKQSRDEQTGKASQSSVILSLILGVSGLVVGVVSLLAK